MAIPKDAGKPSADPSLQSNLIGLPSAAGLHSLPSHEDEEASDQDVHEDDHDDDINDEHDGDNHGSNTPLPNLTASSLPSFTPGPSAAELARARQAAADEAKRREHLDTLEQLAREEEAAAAAAAQASAPSNVTQIGPVQSANPVPSTPAPFSLPVPPSSSPAPSAPVDIQAIVRSIDMDNLANRVATALMGNSSYRATLVNEVTDRARPALTANQRRLDTAPIQAPTASSTSTSSSNNWLLGCLGLGALLLVMGIIGGIAYHFIYPHQPSPQATDAATVPVRETTPARSNATTQGQPIAPAPVATVDASLVSSSMPRVDPPGTACASQASFGSCHSTIDWAHVPDNQVERLRLNCGFEVCCKGLDLDQRHSSSAGQPLTYDMRPRTGSDLTIAEQRGCTAYALLDDARRFGD